MMHFCFADKLMERTLNNVLQIREQNPFFKSRGLMRGGNFLGK
jgi:hypothetical protein